METPTLFNPQQHAHLLPQLVTIHMRCITEPSYTIATFYPPLNQPKMQTWWQDRVHEVERGEREIIVQLSGKEGEGEVVAGVVMLEMPFAETGPFRGVVQKLLVLPEYRKMGFAKRMMVKLEEVARERGRGLLLLDTEKGSPAEDVYPRLGYVKVGEIPRYEMSPLDGSLKDGVFFYKDMR